MDSKLIRVLSFLISAFLIVFVVVQMSGLGSSSDYTAQTVYATTIAENVSMEGFFAREETVIPLPQSGVFSCNYSVGEKAPVKALLGSTYENARSFSGQYGAEDLENTLDALKKAQLITQSTDAVKPDILNSALSSCTARLISAREKGDYSDLAQLKKSYIENFAKKAVVMDPSTDYGEKISALQSSLNSYEVLDDYRLEDVYSTASGYFVDHIDGWEEKVTYASAGEMTVSDFKELAAAYTDYQYDTSSVKVVNSSHWRYVTVLSEENISNIQVGNTVELRFSYIAAPVSVVVETIRRDSGTGEYLVCFYGDFMNSDLLSTRYVEAQMTVKTYQGLKVPKEALRFENGEMGVYVVLMDKMYFRKLDMVYETDSYVISRQSGDKGYLRLYDTVIIAGTGLYEGKSL